MLAVDQTDPLPTNHQERRESLNFLPGERKADNRAPDKRSAASHLAEFGFRKLVGSEVQVAYALSSDISNLPLLFFR